MISSTGQAKIGDFGISRFKQETYLSTKHLDVGTIAYMAPECFLGDGRGITEKCDIYSFAIILWECLTGERPWSKCPNQVGIISQVVVLDTRPEFPKSVAIPESLKRLIRSCWRKNPRERPSSGEILKKLTDTHHQLQGGTKQGVLQRLFVNWHHKLILSCWPLFTTSSRVVKRKSYHIYKAYCND